MLKFNNAGDISDLPQKNNVSDVLRGNRTWGSAEGTVPSGTLVETTNYDDAGLIRKGFTLFGEIPRISRYVS